MESHNHRPKCNKLLIDNNPLFQNKVFLLNCWYYLFPLSLPSQDKRLNLRFHQRCERKRCERWVCNPFNSSAYLSSTQLQKQLKSRDKWMRIYMSKTIETCVEKMCSYHISQKKRGLINGKQSFNIFGNHFCGPIYRC